MLELGAGTALVGLTAAALGAEVTVTDKAELLALMQANYLLNRTRIKRACGSVTVSTLQWAEEEEQGEQEEGQQKQQKQKQQQ